MIIVTGATGQLGSQVVEALLTRCPADQIGVSVRDTDRAGALAARGVRVRRGDFTDPDSLSTAFEDASQVLIVSVDTLGEAGVAQSTAAVDAAYRAGAERVLYTSHQAAAPGSSFAAGRDHAAVEAHLRELDRPYTALRNGYYATTSLGFHIGDAADTGELIAPVDGPVSWTSPTDLAEGAAAILVGKARIDGPTPPLTGSEAVDLADVAAALSEVTGRTVRRVVVDDERFVDLLRDRGIPEPFARLFLGSFQASRDGEFATSDPTLERLIGHRPAGVAEILAARYAPPAAV